MPQKSDSGHPVWVVGATDNWIGVCPRSAWMKSLAEAGNIPLFVRISEFGLGDVTHLDSVLVDLNRNGAAPELLMDGSLKIKPISCCWVQGE